MEPLCAPPTLNHLFTLRCAVGPPLEIGNGPYGRRRCVPITGGTVKGKHLNGEIVPGGADFMLVEENQTTHVNTNYLIKSDDGANIYIQTEGTRSGPPEVLRALMEGSEQVDPSKYWFHLHIKLETGHEKYKWMNNRAEVRLPLAIPGLFLATTGLWTFGFCANNPSEYMWIGMQFGLGMLAFGLMLVPSIGFNYIIEAYGALAPDAFVAIATLRAIISFCWTSFVGHWVTDAGTAVPFGVFGAIMGLFSLLIVPMLLFGKRIRIATEKWVV